MLGVPHTFGPVEGLRAAYTHLKEAIRKPEGVAPLCSPFKGFIEWHRVLE